MPPSAMYSKIAEIAKREFSIDGTVSENLAPQSTQLQSKIRENHASINYDLYGETFAQLYWLRNYWKAVYFFEYEYLYKRFSGYACDTPTVRVVVLGAGSAADSAACMVWLNEHMPIGSRVTIEFVDSSKEQLALAKRIIKKLPSILDKVKWKLSFSIQTIRSWSPSPHAADMVLMSHLLTENSRSMQIICKKAIAALRYGGDILIIERQRDPIWQQAVQYLVNAGVSVQDMQITNEKRKYLSNVLQGNDSHITPQYIKATTASLEYQPDLVAGFFNAWRHQSIPALRTIFTTDSIFDEKPGIEETINGIRGIVQYWKEFPLQQSNIRVNIRNIANEENLTICAFEGEFDKPKEHVVIRGAMNFYIDPYSRKIQKLVEYFGTEKTLR